MPHALTSKQIRYLLRHQSPRTAAGLRNRALMLCYVLGGMTTEEVRTLTVDDVAGLRPALRASMREYLRTLGRESGLVFVPLTGTGTAAISRQRISALLSQCARDAGLRPDYVTAWALKRSGAHLLHEASGYDLAIVAEYLDHESAEQAARYLAETQTPDPDAVWLTVAESIGANS